MFWYQEFSAVPQSIGAMQLQNEGFTGCGMIKVQVSGMKRLSFGIHQS
jgi:hypothetical protein